MKPTNKLRFLQRNEPVVLNGEQFDNWRNILQQWWILNTTMNMGFGEINIGEETGEWRDVPLEKEA